MLTMSGMSAASGTRGRTSQKGAEETRRPKTPRKRWVRVTVTVRVRVRGRVRVRVRVRGRVRVSVKVKVRVRV